MRLIDQTTFGDPGGNCFSACVATVLGLPISEVPYFMGHADWCGAFNAWLLRRGYYAMFLVVEDVNPDTFPWPPGYYIAGGRSSRGGHAVVARGAAIVHDPHPWRSGLVGIEDITLIVPLDHSQFHYLEPHRAEEQAT